MNGHREKNSQRVQWTSSGGHKDVGEEEMKEEYDDEVHHEIHLQLHVACKICKSILGHIVSTYHVLFVSFIIITIAGSSHCSIAFEKCWKYHTVWIRVHVLH